MGQDMSFPAVGGDLHFSRYMKQIHSIPILSEEEEYSLARRWCDLGDIKAAQRLVLSHVRLVAKIAYKFKGYGLPMMDLISEGNIGLMKAVKKFDPDMGYRLSTYAMWWIKATIQEYIIKSWSILKIGTSSLQKKLFFNLNKVKKALMQSGDLDRNAVQGIAADRMGVSVAQVNDMELNFSGNILSLQDKFGESSEESDSSELLDSISASENVEDTMLEMYDKNIMLNRMACAIAQLSERERNIIIARRIKEKPETLEALSATHGVSRERVRQIEEKAMSKLKNLMQLEEQGLVIAADAA